jgi:putative transcriptional regulator
LYGKKKRQTVIAIEGSKYSPTLDLAFRIAGVFGVPLEGVFRYQGGRLSVSADRGVVTGGS